MPPSNPATRAWPAAVIQPDPSDVRHLAAWYVGAVLMVASAAAAILSFIHL